MSIGSGNCGEKTVPSGPPSGRAILDAISIAGVRYVAALPDIVTSDGLLWPISRDQRFRLVRICKEDEGVSICAAMSYNSTRCLLLMQQTGLLDSLNAVRAMAVDYKMPVVMMVGLQGKEPDVPAEQSASYGVRIVPTLLDVMGIRTCRIDAAKDTSAVTAGIRWAYDNSRPVVFLIGRPPTAS